jgi:hypothetical protein
MERKTRIQRNKECEEVYLSLLNNHFTTVTYEKHPDAMMNIIFSGAREKILGKNFRKERISQRKAKKIEQEITTRLRNKYGKWVNMSFFKIKSVSQMQFITNLDKVFTVPDHGTLYGSVYHSSCGNIFFTSHALERFEQRVDKGRYNWFRTWIKGVQKSDPTSVDILCGMIQSSGFVYGRYGDFCHLNLTLGILVLEDLGDIFIAKTFLSPDMVKPVKWYCPDIKAGDVDSINSFVDIMNFGCKPVDKPKFYDDLMDGLKEMVKEECGVDLPDKST